MSENTKTVSTSVEETVTSDLTGKETGKNTKNRETVKAITVTGLFIALTLVFTACVNI